MKYLKTKNIIIVFLPLLIVNCQFNNSKCNKFHEGKFKIIDNLNGTTTYITRKNNIQTEVNNDIGYRIKLRVNWLNDCKYTLKLIEVLENKTNVPTDTSIVLTVEIIESKENSYIQKTTTNKDNQFYGSEVIKIE